MTRKSVRMYQLFNVGSVRLIREGNPFSMNEFLRANEDMTPADLPSAIGDERTFGGGAAPLTVIRRIK